MKFGNNNNRESLAPFYILKDKIFPRGKSTFDIDIPNWDEIPGMDEFNSKDRELSNKFKAAVFMKVCYAITKKLEEAPSRGLLGWLGLR
jgi:hypothetical protein